MTKRLYIGLVAHDRCKPALVAWATRHRELLARHALVATGTTGGAIAEATGLTIERLMSGPKGGDAQLGARIAEGALDALIFFIDPLSALPHDVDVKALVRLATLYDLPFACNEATADALVGDGLFPAR
jgi:methylglyoxal synthase